MHYKLQLQTPRENTILLPLEKGMLTVIIVKIPKIIGTSGEKRILRIVTPTKKTSYYKLPDIPFGHKTHTKVFIDERGGKVLLEDSNKEETLRYCLD
ncbi:MAG: hypothetical protein LC725_02460, partial [Lentisphaerae bacterium]|nr:hypothetical protein [Lentisphaerota bacterium]